MDKDLKHIKFKSHKNIFFDIVDLKEFLGNNKPTSYIYKPHLVKFYAIVFIKTGSGLHTIDFKEYSCVEGMILTIGKNQIHHFHNNSNLEGKLLLFTNDFLVSYLMKIHELRALQLFNDSFSKPILKLSALELEDFTRLIQQIEIEYLETNDDFSIEIIRSQLHILIISLFRIKSKKEPIYRHKKHIDTFIKFQNLVEANVFQSTKVKFYARELGISTKTLNTITKSIIHMNAKEMIDEINMKQVKRLLINTNLSIQEIANKAGFKESSNFHNYFKRQSNTTPEAFRKGQSSY